MGGLSFSRSTGGFARGSGGWDLEAAPRHGAEPPLTKPPLPRRRCSLKNSDHPYVPDLGIDRHGTWRSERARREVTARVRLKLGRDTTRLRRGWQHFLPSADAD